MERNLTSITVRLPLASWTALRSLAESRGEPAAYLIRDALRVGLEGGIIENTPNAGRKKTKLRFTPEQIEALDVVAGREGLCRCHVVERIVSALVGVGR